jgi:hypothetical protein
MNLESIVKEQLKNLKLFSSEPQDAEVSIEEFTQAWRQLGCKILQQQMQERVEAIESKYQGSRQKRSRRYQTPLGTIKLKRRVYGSKGGECRVDEEMGLPPDGWFRSMQELASALGVSSEFGNANQLLERWTGVSVSEKTLANHVESYGAQLDEMEAAQTPEAICPVVSSVSAAVVPPSERPVFYIEADGIHTPMRQG